MDQLFTVQRELPVAAADRLRQMIVENNMQPGDRFPSESKLISMFGVSRSTVREAVKLLIADNVVEIRRGNGTFIASRPGVGKDPLGLHFADRNNLLQGLLETRLLLEPPVARLAAMRATMRDIAMLGETLEQMHTAHNPKAVHAELDIRFHSAVAQCTQNEVLYRFLPIVCESIREGYFETVAIDGSQDRALISHNNIFEAIKNRNPDRAQAETEQHILMTAKDAKIDLGGILK